MMKSIYNVVTFLAALVVLTWAGWQSYIHWDVVKGMCPAAAHKKCCVKCGDNCKCADCQCK